MSKQIRIMPLLAMAAFGMAMSSLSQAAEVPVSGVLASVQLDSGDRSGSENLMYLKMSASWPGGVTCNAAFAGYFDSFQSPFLAAMALRALKEGLTVNVLVDDAHRVPPNICRIINIELVD